MSIDDEKLDGPHYPESMFWRIVTLVLICLFSCALYMTFAVDRGRVEVDIEVSQPSAFQVYWAGANENYSERKMAGVRVHPQKTGYSMTITDLGKVERLRIDTHRYPGEVLLKKLVIRQDGYAPVVLNGEELKQLVPVHQVGNYAIEDDGLRVQATGQDPQLELVIPPRPVALDMQNLLIRLSLVAGIALLAIYGLSSLVKDYRLVPVLLFGVLVVVAVMASISRYNVHPDEYVHVAATKYYMDHWLPPAVDDPEIRDTYSAYGVSRLNNSEIYYLLAGKIGKVAELLGAPQYLSVRILNVLLFALIVICCIRNVYARLVGIPFLLSAQVWYVFSYCCSDALALFITFFAGCQLVDPGSLLHRYLKKEGAGATILGVVLLPLLLGVMFLLKKNYYPFIALFYLGLGVKLFFAEQYYWDRRSAVKKLVVITLLGAALFGLRHGADYYVNGPDRQEKLAVMQEQTAAPWYNPGAAPEMQHSSLYNRERGTSLRDMIMKYHWDAQTLQSSFGVFGYFTVVSPQVFFDMVRWTGSAMLLLLIGSVLVRGGLLGNVMTVFTIGLSCALVAVSLYHSWTVDFQPQGRYLFPIVTMIGVYYGWNYRAVNRVLLLYLAGVMYLFAGYGFIFQALLKLPKIVF
ncbi:hypothetical protein [Desulforhopalus singaporensis]|uniref:Dolichyl-phosphate-mannose-protein mannosyltransferase n=1 Tax=Desulforhopalus singaporensis TaxID=91360 RepID=A0A1H0T0V4_9BACT|nr:hypothetical protein [Desulforhopalus singaporensis]SDP47148.1 hypothetical protein SAMN05660330_02875 [Desulforhopalus singaporensis]